MYRMLELAQEQETDSDDVPAPTQLDDDTPM